MLVSSVFQNTKKRNACPVGLSLTTVCEYVRLAVTAAASAAAADIAAAVATASATADDTYFSRVCSLYFFISLSWKCFVSITNES